MLDGNQACLVAAAHGNLAFALWLPRMAIKLAWLPRMAINQAFLAAAAHGNQSSFLSSCRAREFSAPLFVVYCPGRATQRVAGGNVARSW